MMKQRKVLIKRVWPENAKTTHTLQSNSVHHEKLTQNNNRDMTAIRIK